MMDYKRGDIVTINFNPIKRDEVGKIRPALIISGDEENETLDTIIVMPLSTQLLEKMEPFRLRIVQREGLREDSDLLINHIRTISKKRIGNKIAQISEIEYQEVISNLCENFSLRSHVTKL
ncbi:MAG TPA: type II toxin-antitoxin system PemK/MazF family toxin [Epsilonproteobacteria bacterium]|nr:type II toxin-antitoxin system PemK/MazF family toxin [Campylobacterota bacterium]